MTQTRRVTGVATSIREEGGKTIVRYHSTDVVAFDSQEIVLNSGGRRAATTKLRMNQASHQFGLGFHVYQEDHEWFVTYREQDAEGIPDAVRRIEIPFEDGMTIPRTKKG